MQLPQLCQHRRRFVRASRSFMQAQRLDRSRKREEKQGGRDKQTKVQMGLPKEAKSRRGHFLS
jgi:hypothetical protein